MCQRISFYNEFFFNRFAQVDDGMNTRNRKIRAAKPRLNEFLSPEELEQLSETDKVFVDSSTICAIVQERAFVSSKTQGAIFSKMEVRMLPPRDGKRKRKDMIFFGDYVQLSMIELMLLFEDISEIPEGTVKRVK